MQTTRTTRLDRDVDPARDHILGNPDAEITLVEYGSYLCSHCHTANEMIAHLRERFGEQMRYVFRHLPLEDRHEATRAAEMVEYADVAGGDFWTLHDAIMRRGPNFRAGELEAIALSQGVPTREQKDPVRTREADKRVREDARSGLASGARETPTFFINGRRYEGPWDEASLSEVMRESMGHRLRTATSHFVSWGPSTGVLLLVMTIAAVIVSNTTLGAAFLSFWEQPAGVGLGTRAFYLPLIDWVNHGLLSVFFLVVGLEIKRELTVGRLATRHAAAFPLAAALGGMMVPAAIYFILAPAGLRHAWGITIATDTAFAVAIIVLLGARVSVDLRVFLTAAVVADDLVAILVVALFYSGAISFAWLVASAVITLALVLLNRWQVYRALPYAVLGLALWFGLHEAGIHATLAGVILAMVTPTRPPANLPALLAQAQAIIGTETRNADGAERTRPSADTLRALDAVHDRIESPASKLLHATEPWSNYVVLPVFALANAGLVWSSEILSGQGRLIAAISIALVVGKLVGIFAGARLAVRLGIGSKPSTYSWRQVAGAGGLAGIGFTMSLFIAAQALDGAEYAAAKVAIFLASAVAGVLGTVLLWAPPRRTDPDAVSL